MNQSTTNENNESSTQELQVQLPTADVPLAGDVEGETNDSADTDNVNTEETKSSCLQRSAIALFLLAFIVFVVLDSTIGQGWVGSAVDSFLEWIEENPVPGIFVFVVVYFVATVFFVPGSILTLGAGFVFANAFGLGAGVVLGSLAVFVGASAGALASFVLGRFLLRDWVSGLAAKYALFEALDNALAEKGFRIMVLLRLSPIIPFNALNYIAGVTAIGFWQYTIAMFAILPGTVLYVFLGASAGSLADSGMGNEDTTVTLIVIVVGVVLGVGAVALTSYYAKQELNKVTAKRDADSEGTDEQDVEAAAAADQFDEER